MLLYGTAICNAQSNPPQYTAEVFGTAAWGLTIANPRTVSVQTDAEGNAQLSLFRPSSVAGKRLFMQAADPTSCHVTNLIVRTLR